MFHTTHTPPGACPGCQKILDTASIAGKEFGPRPGDLTICLYCLEISVFNEDLSLRAPSTELELSMAAELARRMLVGILCPRMNEAWARMN